MKTNQIVSVLFWIYKSRMAKGKAPIFCRITVDGVRSQFGIRRSVDPNLWLSESGKVKGYSEEAKSINAHLENIRAEINKHQSILLAKGKPITAFTLKDSYMGVKEKNKGLVEIFQYHNDQMKKLVGIDVVKATHTKFETVLSKLKDFLKKEHKRTEIDLVELDHNFITSFEYFLKIEHKIAHNTAMKYIRNLKKVVNMAVTNNWLPKNPFVNFKCSFKKVTRDILSKEELNQLANKELAFERLREVRDIFLFCCYTGYAFVDVEKLSKNDLVTGIDGGKWIYTSRTKTGTTSNVPLLPPAFEIVEKYKEHPYCEIHNKLLPVKSNQKMNAYLKEIATICEINKPLTMHIARHTFATTVTLSNGVPIETVSKLLGHTKLQTTQIYAQVLENKVSHDMNVLKEKMFTPKEQRYNEAK
jgi:site-specific recombinase XerD